MSQAAKYVVLIEGHGYLQRGRPRLGEFETARRFGDALSAEEAGARYVRHSKAECFYIMPLQDRPA